LIDLPVREALGRIERKRRLDLFERDMGLQQRVRQIYLRIARQKGLKVVDGARPVDEVQADVRKLVAKVL
jgi:thymidylate kinase